MDYERVVQKNVMVLALGTDSEEKGEKHVFFSLKKYSTFRFKESVTFEREHKSI